MKSLSALISIMFCIISGQNAYAQLFKFKKEIQARGSTLFAATLDLNNDSFLDLVSIALDSTSTKRIQFYINSESNDFAPVTSNLTISKLDSLIGLAADVNNDGLIDFLVAGVNTSTEIADILIYENKGSLIFEETSLTTPLSRIEQLEFFDLDNDGKKEMIFSGLTQSHHDTIIIYKKHQNKFVSTQSQLVGAVGAFAIADMNGDARLDFIASKLENGKRYNKLFVNQGNLIFNPLKTKIDSLYLRSVKQIRLSKDENTDLVISGYDGAQECIKVYKQDTLENIFILDQKLNQLRSGSFNIADLNHDGQSDILYKRQNVKGTLDLDIFLNSTNGFVLKDNFTDLDGCQIGDFDGEGNPDLIVFNKKNTSLLVNTSTKNSPPFVPLKPRVTTFHQKIILEWDKVQDDIAPPYQISYEMYIKQGDGGLVYSPESDIITGFRRVFRPGSLGYNTNYLLKGMPNGKYNIAIQSIDNSMLSGLEISKEGGGGCGFSPEVSVLVCDQIAVKNIESCEGFNLFLKAQNGELLDWYSVKNGFLPNGNILKYVVGSEKDTVIAASTATCSNSTMYVINIKDNAVPIVQTIIDTVVCPNSMVNLYPKVSETSIQWYSSLYDSLYVGSILSYKSSIKGDSVFASDSQNHCTSMPIYVIHIIDTTQKASLIEICHGKPIKLERGDFWTNVLWYNSHQQLIDSLGGYVPQDQSETFVVKKGLYKSCKVTDTLKIDIHAKPEIHILADTPNPFGPTSLLATGGIKYLWVPAVGLSAIDVPNPIANPSVTIEYTVKVTDRFNCIDSAKIKVTAKYDLYVPNLFSPNGDGNNDLFQLYGHGIASLLFKIYDRSGNLLFETSDLNKTWDAKYNGIIVKSDLYTWTVAGSFVNGDPLHCQGATTGYLSAFY